MDIKRMQYDLANQTKLVEEKKDLMQGLEKAEIEAVRIVLRTRIEAIDSWLRGFEQEYNSYSKFMDYLLKDEIKKTYTVQKEIYRVRNMLVYAPTQLGKTNMMIRMIKDCVVNGISVIVSCDNKKDQMSQLFERLTRSIEENYNDIFRKCFITTVDNKNFDDIVGEMDEGKTFVMCCLDNKTQIQKVYEKVVGVHSKGLLSTLCVIHDEADVITKSRNVVDVLESQPASHKKWVECMHNYSDNGISVKRVFVTATPENVVYLHKPGYVLELPIPKSYIGSDNITFNEIDNFSEDRIIKLLAREVQARQQEGGIILYCVERNKEENAKDERGTQNCVFESLNTNMRNTGLDAISVYNSDGIRVSLRSKKRRRLFINNLEQTGIKYSLRENRRIIDIKKNEMGISKFYGCMQSIGCKVILTIGKDLISRGISFVSDHKENPLTATTMIYRPGGQLHQVGLCQAIGRLTGTAQPSLIRRLYTTDDVYTNYMTFMNNQKQIINVIKENGNKVDDKLISKISLWKGSRSIDRPVLKLEKHIKFWTERIETDDERMKELIEMWWGADTIIGNILKFVYEHEHGVAEKVLKKYIKMLGSLSKTWYTDLHTPNKEYVKVFCRDSDRFTRLQDAARDYINFIKRQGVELAVVKNCIVEDVGSSSWKKDMNSAEESSTIDTESTRVLPDTYVMESSSGIVLENTVDNTCDGTLESSGTMEVEVDQENTVDNTCDGTLESSGTMEVEVDQENTVENTCEVTLENSVENTCEVTLENSVETVLYSPSSSAYESLQSSTYDSLESSDMDLYYY